MTRPACFSRALRRTLCALLTVLAAGSVQAEWLQLGRTESFRIFVEPNAVQESGGLVKVWQRLDFTTAQWTDAQTVIGSIKSLVEYDCTAMRSRGLSSEAYSEQMGDGRLVASERPADPPWESVDPGTFAETIRQMACAKK